MVHATLSDDEAILTTFLASPPSVTSGSLGGCLERIAAAVAASPQPKSLVSATQNVLTHLFKNPNPDILPHLLPLCQRIPTFEDIDFFVLSTAAWKALIASYHHALRNEDRSPILHPESTTFPIIRHAMRGALVMILRAVAVKQPYPPTMQPAASEATVAVSRYVKVAKFYCLHAVRCVSTFEAHPIRLTHSLYKSFEKTLVEACRLVALVSAILFFRLQVLSSVLRGVEKDVASLAADTLSLLVKLLKTLDDVSDDAPPSRNNNQLPHVGVIITNVLHSFNKGDDDGNSRGGPFQVDGVVAPYSPSVLLWFAIIHLMRHASVQPCSAPGGGDKGIGDGLRGCFSKLLCRSLFQLLDEIYTEAVTLREPTTGTLLADAIASAVCESILAFEANRVRGEENASTTVSNGDTPDVVACSGSAKTDSSVLREALLLEMSMVNNLRALVASNCLALLFERAEVSPQLMSSRFSLLMEVMVGARVALALGSAHAHSRWLPLAGRLSMCCVRGDDPSLRDVLRRAISESEAVGSRGWTGIVDGNVDRSGGSLDIHSVFVLFLVAATCDMMFQAGDGSKGNGSKDANDNVDNVDNILSCFMWKRVNLCSFITNCVASKWTDSTMTHAVLRLAQHVMDTASCTRIAIQVLKRMPQNGETFCIATNMLCDVGQLTTGDGMKSLTDAVSRGVELHGGMGCVCAARFVHRMVVAGTARRRREDWNGLRALLDVTVRKALRMEGVVGDVVRGGVLTSAARLLRCVGATVGSGVGDGLGLTDGPVRRAVEEAEEWLREFELKMESGCGIGDGMDVLAQERELIEREKRASGQGAKISDGKALSMKGLEAARESVVDVFRSVVKEGKEGSGRAEIIGEIEMLQSIVECLARWARER